MWYVIAIGLELIVILYLICIALNKSIALKEKENNAEIKSLRDLRQQDQRNYVRILKVNEKIDLERIHLKGQLGDIKTWVNREDTDAEVRQKIKELLFFKQQLKRKI